MTLCQLRVDPLASRLPTTTSGYTGSDSFFEFGDANNVIKVMGSFEAGSEPGRRHQRIW